MDEMISINYNSEAPTVSARDLHDGLEIKSNFATWFDRMCEYGFTDSDYSVVWSDSKNGNAVEFEKSAQFMSAKGYTMDAQITVDMAKQICMLQRTDKGKQYRQYFLDLEKAWNTPEQIYARALRMADKEIQRLKDGTMKLQEDVNRMKPKEIFADAVTTSQTSILIGELAKILKQNGYDTGEKRLFAWLRDNGYLIRRKGTDYNAPTQKSMELGLFEVKETAVTHADGHVTVNKTTKVTGKGQQYFINKFLGGEDQTA